MLMTNKPCIKCKKLIEHVKPQFLGTLRTEPLVKYTVAHKECMETLK